MLWSSFLAKLNKSIYIINQKIIADIKTNNLCDNIYSLLKNNVDDKKGFEKEHDVSEE